MDEFKEKLVKLSQKANQDKEAKDLAQYNQILDYMEQRMINSASRGEVKASFKFRKRKHFEYFIQTGMEDTMECKNMEKLVELSEKKFKLKPKYSVHEQSNSYDVEFCWR